MTQAIWGATDRGPATGTMRFPVDTGSSSSPGYLSIDEAKTYFLSQIAITSGKTLTASNTLTFAGTDGSTLNIGAGGTLGLSSYQPILIVPIQAQSNAFVTWTAMPAAATLYDGSSRYNAIAQIDLTNYTQVRMTSVIGTAGASGSKLIARYNTAVSSPPVVGDFTADIGTSEVSVSLTTGTKMLSSSWINLAAGAKGDVFLAIVGLNGDGTAAPTIGNIYLQFR